MFLVLIGVQLVAVIILTSITCTGWLKIKYPSRQYAISPQPVARF